MLTILYDVNISDNEAPYIREADKKINVKLKVKNFTFTTDIELTVV